MKQYQDVGFEMTVQDCHWLVEVLDREVAINPTATVLTETLVTLQGWYQRKGVTLDLDQVQASIPALLANAESLMHHETMRRQVFETAQELFPRFNALADREDFDSEAYHREVGDVLDLWDKLMHDAPRFDGEPVPETVKEGIAELRGLHNERIRLRSVRYQREQERLRTERIAARRAARPEPATMEGTRCSVCQKKPARIDGMCKKCARASGVIVHGKIGES